MQRVKVKGGVLSPSELKGIIAYAQELGLKDFHFGSRQDILFPTHNVAGEPIEQHKAYDASVFYGQPLQNISCSYVSIDILNSTVWLRGTTYLYILEQFTYEPKLKINITDPIQQMVPLYSGELNFIASKQEDYWYLFLKLKGLNAEFYPVLIYTWDIAKIAQEIENCYHKATSVEELFHLVNERGETNNKNIDKPLQVQFKPFPYYEGMNKMGVDNYWLGLYWRNNRYSLEFLDTLCDFCIEQRVGKICLTPWKSFVIKGIPRKSKLELERLLGTFGINVRHSSLELNWHLPVGDTEALALKKTLVYDFDQKDISTYGMTFGISNNQKQSQYFTSVVIEKNEISDAVKKYGSTPTYNVLHAKNFDPNSRVYQMYAQGIDQMNLPIILMELTQTYFKNLGNETLLPVASKKTKEVEEVEVYQCMDCETVYDPEVGDLLADIAPGVSFEKLPTDYCCSLCAAPKSHFKHIVLHKV